MHLYKQLHKTLTYLEKDKIEQIYQAYLLAQEVHQNQKRDNGESYIIHPVAAAIILADMHMDYQSIIAALLHDVIEDTPITKNEIAKQFGQQVAELVDGVTKLTQIEASSKAEAQAESFRKMVLAMSRDIRVILIKLADRLHNMRTIGAVVPHKRIRIAKETLDIYAPIANRLGMHEIYVELENLAFAALYPRRYRVLQDAVEKASGNRKEIMKTIEQEIKLGFTKSSLSDYKFYGREKHLYSIYRKMRVRHASFSTIMDVYAFRVLVNSIDDCYRALGVLHSVYKPVPGKFKDYIAIPKYNGYQSLHTILFGPYGVPVELQIRTQAMDQFANSGIAAHWLYKANDKVQDAAHIRAQQWINNLLEMQQNTGSSLEFIENVKIDLFPDEVYLFTPKGHILELPRGATVVDFAYAVHTDIGNTCIAARIDHQFMSLATVLTNGQTISIITAPDAKPNPGWLNFAVTAKARSGIRTFLKSQKRSEAIALGKQLLENALSELVIDFKKIPPHAFELVYKEARLKQLDDLYEEIGMGNRLAVFVAHQLSNAIEKQAAVSEQHKHELKPLLIHGAEGLAITFASCCNPIPGDAIVGYLSTGHGLEIHTGDCPSAAKFRKQPEKYLHVRWADDVSGDFKVILNVEIINQPGSLAAVSKAVAAANSNIDDISMTEPSTGYHLVTLKLLVKNIAHLERVIRHLSSLPVVVGVIRKKG